MARVYIILSFGTVVGVLPTADLAKRKAEAYSKNRQERYSKEYGYVEIEAWEIGGAMCGHFVYTSAETHAYHWVGEESTLGLGGT